MTADDARLRVARRLAAAGCIAPTEEAEELLRAAGSDERVLDGFVRRREQGEPLAWITGSTAFCGLRVRMDPGVYVPRPHTEVLAERAASLVPARGIAVDLCTGSGAVGAAILAARPGATVLATDRDPAAVACARRNGVRALLGDLDEPLPADVRGLVDVMTAVAPYVPTEELHLLARDVQRYEPRHALDGGPAGTVVLERVVACARRWLRPGGRLLLEIGGDQASALAPTLSVVGFTTNDVHRDRDGQDRAIEATASG